MKFYLLKVEELYVAETRDRPASGAVAHVSRNSYCFIASLQISNVPLLQEKEGDSERPIRKIKFRCRIIELFKQS